MTKEVQHNIKEVKRWKRSNIFSLFFQEIKDIETDFYLSYAMLMRVNNFTTLWNIIAIENKYPKFQSKLLWKKESSKT